MAAKKSGGDEPRRPDPKPKSPPPRPARPTERRPTRDDQIDKRGGTDTVRNTVPPPKPPKR